MDQKFTDRDRKSRTDSDQDQKFLEIQTYQTGTNFSGPAKNLKHQTVDPCYESTLPRPTNHNNIYIESSRTSASGSSDGIETSADVFNLNVFLIKDYFHIFLLPILKYLHVMDHYHQFHKVLLRFGPNPY